MVAIMMPIPQIDKGTTDPSKIQLLVLLYVLYMMLLYLSFCIQMYSRFYFLIGPDDHFSQQQCVSLAILTVGAKAWWIEGGRIRVLSC